MEEAKPLGIRKILSLLETQLNKLSKKDKKMYAYWVKNIYLMCQKSLLSRTKEFLSDNFSISNIMKVLNKVKEETIECLEQMPRLSL